MDGVWSDLDNLYRRVAVLHSGSGGVIALARFQEFGSGGHPITVSASL